MGLSTHLSLHQTTQTYWKLYLGITIQDPEKYNGSGVRWKAHIRKHGTAHIETLWYCLFLDQESLSEFALNFSKQENIAESEDWLNLMYETGLHRKGTVGRIVSDESKLKSRMTQLGRVGVFKHSEKTKQMMKDTRSGMNLGKVHSEESRKNMSDAHRKPQRRVQCPHCEFIGGVNRMGQNHFDKCKKKR